MKEIKDHQQKLNLQIEKQTQALQVAQEKLEALQARYPYLDPKNPHKKEYATLIESLKQNIRQGQKALSKLLETLDNLGKL